MSEEGKDKGFLEKLRARMKKYSANEEEIARVEKKWEELGALGHC